MKLRKFSTVDAFAAIDLPNAPAAGVVRCAPKVLRSSTEMLARSMTYSLATFGLRLSGASWGINVGDDRRGESIERFVTEVREPVFAGDWFIDPALGVTESDLAPLREHDRRPSSLWEDNAASRLRAEAAVACASAVLGGIEKRTVALVGPASEVAAAQVAVDAAGASVVEDGLVDSNVDVILVAGKVGVIDHRLAESVVAKAVVPLTPLPVTTKAHAVLTRSGVVHVPDFLPLAAPLLFAHASTMGDPVRLVADMATDLNQDNTDLWRSAVDRAETFLQTWQDELPFGRPLA